MSDKESSTTLEERYGSLSAKRFEDESFEEYKERMKFTKYALRAYMKGVKISPEEYKNSKQ